MLRWSDPDHASNDHGLAIDEFSVTPHGVATTQPTLSIDDVHRAKATRDDNFTFTVSLDSPAGAGGVTFDIATSDGSAAATSDYVAQSLTAQVIPQGSSSYPFTVQVNGDMSPEPNDTFFVTVSNIVGATPGDVQGLGTIQNDDFSLTHIHDIQGSGDTSPFAGQIRHDRGHRHRASRATASSSRKPRATTTPIRIPPKACSSSRARRRRRPPQSATSSPSRRP